MTFAIENFETKAIAHELGIEFEEFLKIKYKIEDIVDEDDFTTGHTIYIENSTEIPEVLEKIKALDKERNCVEFSSLSFDDYSAQLDAMLGHADIFQNFLNHNNAILELNKLNVGSKEQVLKQTLYVSLIGNLEAFLSTAFIRKLDDDIVFLKKFVTTYPDFKKRTFKLNEFYDVQSSLLMKVKNCLLDIIYHHLEKVKNMYEQTFDIKFPHIGNLVKAVKVRHDLVHRNGKSKDGESIILKSEGITELSEQIVSFVEEIARQLNLDRFQ